MYGDAGADGEGHTDGYGDAADDFADDDEHGNFDETDDVDADGDDVEYADGDDDDADDADHDADDADDDADDDFERKMHTKKQRSIHFFGRPPGGFPKFWAAAARQLRGSWRQLAGVTPRVPAPGSGPTNCMGILFHIP